MLCIAVGASESRVFLSLYMFGMFLKDSILAKSSDRICSLFHQFTVVVPLETVSAVAMVTTKPPHRVGGAGHERF